MTITPLIARLQRIRDLNGDIEIRLATNSMKTVRDPSTQHLRAGKAAGYWDSRLHRPESKGEKVCVL